jgi:hypothetical protein
MFVFLVFMRHHRCRRFVAGTLDCQNASQVPLWHEACTTELRSSL